VRFLPALYWKVETTQAGQAVFVLPMHIWPGMHFPIV